MQQLSIIIPVYNEEASIDEVLKRVFAVRLEGWKKQVIVVNDGSTDKTGGILASWKKNITLLVQSKNQGKGAAIAVGIKQATGQLILIQDADLEYSPADYPKLLEPFSNARVTVVYGSRFLGPHLSTMYLYALGNKFVTWVTNILYNTNITDMETGYKVFRRTVLDGIFIQARRFDLSRSLPPKYSNSAIRSMKCPFPISAVSSPKGKN